MANDRTAEVDKMIRNYENDHTLPALYADEDDRTIRVLSSTNGELQIQVSGQESMYVWAVDFFALVYGEAAEAEEAMGRKLELPKAGA